MALQQERPLTAFGTGLCLHQPGCCPARSICSMATPIELQIPAPSLPKEFLFFDDGPELQAREILGSAGREISEQQEQAEAAGVGDGAAEPATAAFPGGAVLALSMKRSLRRFLEKRAARLNQASSSPYSVAEKLQSTSTGGIQQDAVEFGIPN